MTTSQSQDAWWWYEHKLISFEGIPKYGNAVDLDQKVSKDNRREREDHAYMEHHGEGS